MKRITCTLITIALVMWTFSPAQGNAKGELKMAGRVASLNIISPDVEEFFGEVARCDDLHPAARSPSFEPYSKLGSKPRLCLSRWT